MNEKDILRLFGYKIKLYRKANKYYQDDLAAGTGLSKPYLAKVELGEHSLSLVNALKIVNFFGKSLNDFLDRKYTD